MKTTDLKALVEAVEAVRKEMHPDLSRGFLGAVIQAEEANPENDEAALRAIQAALEVALRTSGAS